MDDIKLEDIPPGWWMGCHTKDGMRVKGFSEAEYIEGEKKGTVQRDSNGKPIYAKFTPDVLNKFCCNYRYRYPLHSDDYMYATDGQIAIRIPRRAYVFFFEFHGDKVPVGVENTFERTKPGKTGYSLPLYNQTCWEGENIIIEPIFIGPCLVQYCYVDKLMTYMPRAIFYPTAPEAGIYFTFDGGEGILMPMRQDKEILPAATS